MKKVIWISIIPVICILFTVSSGQVLDEFVHKRGRLWENVRNDVMIGSLGVWDYGIAFPVGFFPSFFGYTHPINGEGNAYGSAGGYIYANANLHNFRSGCWIVAKDLLIPGNAPDYAPTPTDYEAFLGNIQTDPRGVESDRDPMEVQKNYIEEEGFNPLLPEEYVKAQWHTNTGITVTRYSYVWSYPGYRNFIIYDYWFENTGQIVSTSKDEVIPDFPPQTLNDV
ncbi:hypothetical protein ES708_22765 [subsurface metagenome]